VTHSTILSFNQAKVLRNTLKITEQTHGDNIYGIAVQAIGVYPR